MLSFQNGDESAFEKLVERNKNKVFSLAYRFIGNYPEAEDTTQQVFIKVYRAKNIYKPRAKFSTWLYVVCKNTCLKKLRKKRFHTISLNENISVNSTNIPRQIKDTHTPSPRDITLNNEKADIVKDAVDSLPANQRMAVILYRYERFLCEKIWG